MNRLSILESFRSPLAASKYFPDAVLRPDTDLESIPLTERDGVAHPPGSCHANSPNVCCACQQAHPGRLIVPDTVKKILKKGQQTSNFDPRNPNSGWAFEPGRLSRHLRRRFFSYLSVNLLLKQAHQPGQQPSVMSSLLESHSAPSLGWWRLEMSQSNRHRDGWRRGRRQADELRALGDSRLFLDTPKTGGGVGEGKKKEKKREKFVWVY